MRRTIVAINLVILFRVQSLFYLPSQYQSCKTVQKSRSPLNLNNIVVIKSHKKLVKLNTLINDKIGKF